MHEYSVVGHPRERIIFYISLLSVVAAPLITAALARIVSFIGFNVGTISVGSGLVFAVLFWLFNTVLWRLSIAQRIIGVPDLGGVWICQGHSVDYATKKERDWSGVLQITQTWNKIQVVLRTNESHSYSTSAIGGMKKLADRTFVLSYQYDNTPSGAQPILHAHSGLCSLVFDLKTETAEGQYFNNKDRSTNGIMKLRRKM